MMKKVSRNILLITFIGTIGLTSTFSSTSPSTKKTEKKEKQSMVEMIKQAKEQKRALIKRLLESEIADIVGVVHPGGPGGVGDRSSGERLWSLLFELQPWRQQNGKLDERKLLIRKIQLSEKELEQMMNEIKPYDILSVRVRLDAQSYENPGAKYVHALLLDITRKATPDEELLRRRTEMLIPVVIEDTFFGTLVLDREQDQYEGKRTLGDITYRVSIECLEGNKIDARFAQKRIEYLEKKLPDIRNTIADKLHNTYNSLWRTLGQVSRTDFMGKIKLDAVSISTTGFMTVYFTDGGMFDGHYIELFIDAKGNIKNPGLVG